MHVSLSPESGNGRALEQELEQELIKGLQQDPVWQALQIQTPLPQAPNFSDDEVRALIDKLHEPKMMDRLQALLQDLPTESQQLLDRLQEARLQSA